MSTLFELTEEYMELLEIMQDPFADPQTVEDTLESVGGEIEDKADGYANVIATLEADVEAVKKEQARLDLIRKSRESNIARLKENLQAAMEGTGKVKFKTALHSFSIQSNPPRVVLTGEPTREWLIPQQPKTDLAGIRDALKSGKDLEFAHLEQGRSLRIR